MTAAGKAGSIEDERALLAGLDAGLPAERVDAWLRALGVWFDDEPGWLPSVLLDFHDAARAARALQACVAVASPAGALRARVALARLGASDAPEHAALVGDERLPAGVAFQLADVLDVPLADAVAARLAARLAALLTDSGAGHAPDSRAARAEALKLPVSARRLRAHAADVLRVLVEDPALRPWFADRAARLWIELDIHDALPAALGVAHEVSAMTLLSLALTIDRDEAFELLAARFVADPFFCELLSRTGAELVRGDDRWVPYAMSRVDDDPRAALRLLCVVRTPRADEELAGVLERRLAHAAALDEASLELIEATAARAARVLDDALAAALAGPWVARVPDAQRQRVRAAVSARADELHARVARYHGAEAAERVAWLLALDADGFDDESLDPFVD